MATVTWNEELESWEIYGGVILAPIRVTPLELKESFPRYFDAVVEFCKSSEHWSSTEDETQILGRAAFALTEDELPRKRYQVYRALALFLGYKDRTELPSGLDRAVKSTWSSEGEFLLVLEKLRKSNVADREMSADSPRWVVVSTLSRVIVERLSIMLLWSQFVLRRFRSHLMISIQFSLTWIEISADQLKLHLVAQEIEGGVEQIRGRIQKV
ncbi:hypothetical protein R1sor_023732 [Riccia sorocarpa]|uniref:Uncharacterized protein n=1 Tax=Riccia sorocarpa TaxID=122646 RepID=A0ABD3GQA6_9MARC